MSNISGEILFEKFEIIECLKKDSYTGVYLANHIYLGKKIVLKTLNTDNLQDKTLLDRFKREAKILAQLEHPNLIKVLDFGNFSHYFYISFEYFQSRNLREVFNHPNLNDENKKNIFIQLLRALNIAHQNQIIHRDIKPENILVDESYHLKIADFGLAMIQSEENITQASSIVGTPGYMSPEQLRGEKSLQADLFSAGVVVYEMYSGKNPFSEETISDTINKILNYDEKSGLFDYEKLPAEIRPAIKSMLRKNIKDRAKSVNEILSSFGISGEIYKPVEANKKNSHLKKIYYSLAFIIIFILTILIFKNPFSGTSLNSNEQQTPEKKLALSDTSISKNFSKDSSNLNLMPEKLKNDRENDQNKKEVLSKSLTGKLFVECKPWADVYLDDRKIETTPLKDYINVKNGRHTLKLVHPDFPAYVKRIYINSDSIESIAIDFNQLVGYLKCDIYPWGEVFINDVSEGITPIRKPIALYGGTYKITVKNPKYADHSESIKISLKDTVQYNFNFETMTKMKSELSNSK